MTKTRPRQLELPVMVNVNGKVQAARNPSAGSASRTHTDETGFHKLASADDQSIYKAISDNYFNAAKK